MEADGTDMQGEMAVIMGGGEKAMVLDEVANRTAGMDMTTTIITGRKVAEGKEETTMVVVMTMVDVMNCVRRSPPLVIPIRKMKSRKMIMVKKILAGIIVL